MKKMEKKKLFSWKDKKLHKVALMGGSFDPVHLAHLALVQEVRNKFPLDEIWVLPSPLPGHKQERAILPFIFRHALCELAFQDYDYVRVLDIESHLPLPSRTLHVLRYLHQQAQRERQRIEWYFILGADEFLHLNAWYDFKKIGRFCRFLVFDRPGFEKQEIKEKQNYYKKFYGIRSYYLSMEKTYTIASSKLRPLLERIGTFFSQENNVSASSLGVLKVEKDENKGKLHKDKVNSTKIEDPLLDANTFPLAGGLGSFAFQPSSFSAEPIHHQVLNENEKQNLLAKFMQNISIWTQEEKKYLSESLPASVLLYILQTRIYGIWKSLTQEWSYSFYHQWVKESLTLHHFSSLKRSLHSHHVVFMALIFAKFYSLDMEQLSMAALLHDFTKYWSAEKSLALVPSLADWASKSYPIWHAETAYAYFSQFPFVSGIKLKDETLNAIRYHALPRPDGTKMEYLLYLADKVEFSRPFQDLLPIREAMQRDLAQAMKLCILATPQGKKILELESIKLKAKLEAQPKAIYKNDRENMDREEKLKLSSLPPYTEERLLAILKQVDNCDTLRAKQIVKRLEEI